MLPRFIHVKSHSQCFVIFSQVNNFVYFVDYATFCQFWKLLSLANNIITNIIAANNKHAHLFKLIFIYIILYV